MKVLVDANVLIDYLTKREPFYEDAKKIISCCLFMVDGFIAPHSFVEIFYAMHERGKFSVEECREAILKLCAVFEVASENKTVILQAVKNIDFSDFEDSLQNECAISSETDCIVTRNAKDFKGSKIQIYSPEEFLKMMEKFIFNNSSQP
ncbi:MAG: PIN domain-containing protein [Treponema sp.]|nr:PIN domain-containing protein [Treponema sp.]MBR6913979.1 PIN domain-containing protein [Treponema sp.]